jgi:hypothetical protein
VGELAKGRARSSTPEGDDDKEDIEAQCGLGLEKRLSPGVLGLSERAPSSIAANDMSQESWVGSGGRIRV